MARRRLDCPAFRRALETGQTKRRILQTYTVAHSTGISEALRSLRVWGRICAPARSVHSGFRNARSVRRQPKRVTESEGVAASGCGNLPGPSGMMARAGLVIKMKPTFRTATTVDERVHFCLLNLMQIESLKMFCDLADTQSFTKAAQLNGVTQSAISQQMTMLERIFKSLLVERSKKQFRPTPEGQVLYDYGKQILQLYGSLDSKLLELKDVISGTIRVATIYSIGLHDLPPCIKKFMNSYPTVNIHVEYRSAHQVHEDVVSNSVDLGLIAYPVRDSKLEIVPLRKEPLVLVCHPQHPFTKQKSIKLKSLNGQKFISFEPDTPTRKALDKILKQHGVEVKHVMEFDNVETVKRAVEIGTGISIVPQGAVVQEIEKGTLATVEIADGEFYRPLAAIYKKNRVLSPAMKQFLAILKNAA
jgi:DNA-binding transcriptional LysR family regulator